MYYKLGNHLVICYKRTGDFSPETEKGEMKKISTKREKPFKTANLPASLLPVHFNWLFDVIRELLTSHYITFMIELRIS